MMAKELRYIRKFSQPLTLLILQMLKTEFVVCLVFCDKNVKNLIADKLLSFDAAKVGLVSVLKKDFGCVFVFNSDFYKNNINFLLSSVENFCKKSSIIYVFKSNKNLLNLECFVEQKNVRFFLSFFNKKSFTMKLFLYIVLFSVVLCNHPCCVV